MEKGKRKAGGAGKRGRDPESGAKAMARQMNTTLGDLIAAAFDTAGSEVMAVAALMSSSQMARIIGKRIVLI
jgi:hypothetical protein